MLLPCYRAYIYQIHKYRYHIWKKAMNLPKHNSKSIRFVRRCVSILTLFICEIHFTKTIKHTNEIFWKLLLFLWFGLFCFETRNIL